jgi:hypothetical protein
MQSLTIGEFARLSTSSMVLFTNYNSPDSPQPSAAESAGQTLGLALREIKYNEKLSRE